MAPAVASAAILSGSHPVSLGSSFRRPAKHSPYHSLRYNFQPSTVDNSLPSSLSGGSVDGTGEYSLLVPSKDAKQGHLFKGSQTQQKEVECLLIWDEDSQSYRLEKLGSVLRLEHQRTQVTMPQIGHQVLVGTSLESSPLKSHESGSTPADSQRSKAGALVDVDGHDDSGAPPPKKRRQSIESPSMSKPRRPIALKSYPPKPQSPPPVVVSHDEDEDEDEDEDDEDLDDFANELVSTLDQAAASLEDESSEDED